MERNWLFGTIMVDSRFNSIIHRGVCGRTFLFVIIYLSIIHLSIIYQIYHLSNPSTIYLICLFYVSIIYLSSDLFYLFYVSIYLSSYLSIMSILSSTYLYIYLSVICLMFLFYHLSIYHLSII